MQLTPRTPNRRPSWRKIGIIISMMGLLSGCATTPMPALNGSVPAKWRHHTGNPNYSPTKLYAWWQVFKDPLLNKLVHKAVHANLDVAQARERLRAERALYGIRQSPNRPQLFAHTQDTTDPDAKDSYFIAGFDATWELPLFGRGEADDRVAEGRLGEAAATLHEARVSMAAEVVRAYLQLRAAQHSEALMQQILRARQHAAQLVQTRVSLHLDSPMAATKAAVAVEEAQAELSGPRARINSAAQRLAVLLGRDEPAADWLRPSALPTLGPHGPISSPVIMLRSQPQVALARARVIKAAGKLGIAHANRFPSIGLGASLIWSINIASEQLTGTSHAIGTAGPILDIPLFDWGIRKAKELARGHLLKAAVLAYRKAVLSAVSNVETALGNLQQEHSREDAHQKIYAMWQKALKTQQTRRRLGLTSGLDGVSVTVADAQAALKLTEARRDRDIAFVALYKALGGAPPNPSAKPASQTNRSKAPS